MKHKIMTIATALGVLLLLAAGLFASGKAEAAVVSGDNCEPGYTFATHATMLDDDLTAGATIRAAASGLSTATGAFRPPAIETDCVPMYLCESYLISSYPGPVWIHICHFIGWNCS